VKLAGGTNLDYDRAVVAPGIAFKFGAIEGYDEAAAQIIPHAWNAGHRRSCCDSNSKHGGDGGIFVIVAPPNPFRCPPGPYERACLVAYYFKQFKRRSKILILDAKDSFFEQDLFQDAWSRHYPGMIEWLPGQFTGGVKSVDLKPERSRLRARPSMPASPISSRRRWPASWRSGRGWRINRAGARSIP